MKASPQLRSTVAGAIAPVDTKANRDRYRSGDFPRSDRTKDLDKRYRWDLYYHACNTAGPFHTYTAGLNDAHIDTMLRSIVAPL